MSNLCCILLFILKWQKPFHQGYYYLCHNSLWIWWVLGFFQRRNIRKLKLNVHLHQSQPGGRKTVLHHPPVDAGDKHVSKNETPVYSTADFIRLTFDISCSQSWSINRVTSALLIMNGAKSFIWRTWKGSAGLPVAKRCINSDYFVFCDG